MIEQGLTAFQSGQYLEALHCFEQSLPRVRSRSERERVRMWIARCSLNLGCERQLLDACSELLSSPDAGVRAFARAGLRQYGLDHPGRGFVIEPGLARVVAVSVQVYFDQFWPLLIQSLVAGAWGTGMSVTALVWGAFILGRGPGTMSAGASTALGAAQALWWVLLAVVPGAVCGLIALDRILRAHLAQRRRVLRRIGVAAPGDTTEAQHRNYLTYLGCLFVSLAVLALPVLLVPVHWWLAALVALGVQPWLLCLWLTAKLAVQERSEK